MRTLLSNKTIYKINILIFQYYADAMKFPVIQTSTHNRSQIILQDIKHKLQDRHGLWLMGMGT